MKGFFNMMNIAICYTFGIRRKIYPLKILIEPTNACNFDCIMCPRKNMKRKIGFMDFGLFKKIVKESKDFVNEYQFSFMGEPLLHPKIFDMIKYANSQGVYTYLFTNSSLLDGNAQKRIVDSGLDKILITIDGATKETYEKIRKGGDYETTISNLESFLEYRKEHSSKKPKVILQIIKMKENTGEIEAFVDRHKSEAIDELRVRTFDTWAGNREIMSHSSSAKAEREKNIKCTQLWTTMVVTWDGKIVACCRDFDSNVVFGDLNSDNLIDVWNGPRTNNFRTHHSSSALCRNCLEWKKEKNPTVIMNFFKRHI